MEMLFHFTYLSDSPSFCCISQSEPLEREDSCWYHWEIAQVQAGAGGHSGGVPFFLICCQYHGVLVAWKDTERRYSRGIDDFGGWLRSLVTAGE